MIPDVDETLRGLVRREALNGSGVDVAFDAPTRDWVARRSGPTVSMYLYDIREDLARREVQWEPVRNSYGVIAERRPPARRFKLSYMVTAWTQRPEDEHRLLSSLLACFIRHERIGPEALSGALADQPLPLFMTTALPLGTDRSIADVWSALGGELKPSLDLVITTPFVDSRTETAGPPVREEPRFSVFPSDGNGSGASGSNGHGRGGRGAGTGPGGRASAGAAGAGGAAGAAGSGGTAGSAGAGQAGATGAGAGTAAAGGKGASGPAGAAGAPGSPGGASEAGGGPGGPGAKGRAGHAGLTADQRAEPAETEEQVRKGTETLPGRIIRVRTMRRSG